MPGNPPYGDTPTNGFLENPARRATGFVRTWLALALQSGEPLWQRRGLPH